MTYLAPRLSRLFNTHSLFSQISTLEGEMFRDVAGRKTFRVVLDDQAYFAKVHYGVGWGEIVKNLLQLRLPVLGAGNEWRAIQKLHELNVETMTAVAYSNEGLNPAQQRSCIMTEALHETTSLEDLVLGGGLTLRLKRQLTPRLAQVSRTLHNNGVNHRDYYLCHFLLSNDSIKESEIGHLYLIDLHRVQIRSGRVPDRWIEKDLAGLLFSAADAGITYRGLYRFVRVYCSKPLGQVIQEDGAFWCRVVSKARKLYIKDQGRPSAFLESLDLIQAINLVESR